MDTNVNEVEIYKADDGWRWRAKAGNGEIVATGESHGTAADAQRAAMGVFPAVPCFLADPHKDKNKDDDEGKPLGRPIAEI
jgi:uncharacterized protein YegP (UPF0339 family)